MFKVDGNVVVKIYVGLNDKDTKQQTYDYAAACDAIAVLLDLRGIEGATLYHANGIWKREQERTVIIELLYVDDMIQVYTLCKTLQKFFNQKEVLYTVEQLRLIQSVL